MFRIQAEIGKQFVLRRMTLKADPFSLALNNADAPKVQAYLGVVTGRKYPDLYIGRDLLLPVHVFVCVVYTYLICLSNL